MKFINSLIFVLFIIGQYKIYSSDYYNFNNEEKNYINSVRNKNLGISTIVYSKIFNNLNNYNLILLESQKFKILS